ncbi:MAG: hypothetical protein NT023_07570 [Armatimonadetes bacterium]|nr:hypothetical protein [Armatimonadota bacterium]
MTPPFTLTPPQGRTKGEVKRLRLAGFIPVSIQHKGMDTQHYQVEAAPLQEFLKQHGHTALVELLIMPGEIRQRGIVQGLQRDAISLKIQQLTLQLVRIEDTLKTQVPISFVGKPAMVNPNEAMVIHQADHLLIECAQNDLPEYILVDVTHLVPGGVIHVSDLAPDARYKILTPSHTSLVSLTRTRGGGSTADATEAAATA